MEYDDTLRISTPEGVELSVLLAGVGSRFASALIDFTIQVVLIIAVSLFAVAVGATLGSGAATGVVALASFALFVSYDVFFEVLHDGRTPGKKLNGLRVVREDGRPIRFVPSVIRNVLRIIDFLPAFYLTGIVSIIGTHQNQRVGDVVAGTVVVRERTATIPAPATTWAAEPPRLQPPQIAATLDFGAITPEDVIAVRRYLERRDLIPYASRNEIATTLAARLLPKVSGVPEGTTVEQFLAAIATSRDIGFVADTARRLQ